MAVRRSAIPVSADLTDTAVHLWEFLRLIDSHPWLYEGLHVHNAIRRYEKLWLPLAARVGPQLLLSAPLDIEWVWYVHMLSPYAYHRDCLHRFGQVIPHKIGSTKERNIGLNNAKEIWEKLFRKETFSVDLTAAPKIMRKFTSKFSYDLSSAISRQRFFTYQVALKHYCDNQFLERAVKRYKDFLCAKLQDPTLTLNGCFDVQFIWHAHMSHPVLYRDDTRKIFGEMLSHYDTDVGSGIVSWNSSPERTKNPSAPKSIPGAMYRGEAVICTPERIVLTQQKEELTFKVKLLREEFHHAVAIAKSQRARELTMSPCWFDLPSLTLDCLSHVINLTNGKADKVYNVKVTHSLAPVLSTVEVIHPKDHLIVTAHTIAGKQLPIKSQLESMRGKCCAYNPEAKERALLIRSQKDWGICVGKWVGNSDAGELVISFFNMETNEWQTVNSSNTSNQPESTMYEIKIFGKEKSVFINLGTGMVTIPYNEIATFIPEIIALAYSIGVLYVLCRERSREFYPVEPFLSTEQKGLQPYPFIKQIKASKTTKRDGVFSTGSSGKKSLWLNRDPFVSSLLLATGRNCPWAPSNSFLRCFHENVTSVFGHCTLGCDNHSSADALLEIGHLLENLGIKKNASTPIKRKNKKQKVNDKKRGSEGSGDALSAAKERFSNVNLNDSSDQEEGEVKNKRRAKSEDEMSHGTGEDAVDGRLKDKKRDKRKGEKRREMAYHQSDSETRNERQHEKREKRRDDLSDPTTKNIRRDGRENREDTGRHGKRDRRRSGIRDDISDDMTESTRSERSDGRRNTGDEEGYKRRGKRNDLGYGMNGNTQERGKSRGSENGYERRHKRRSEARDDLSDEMTESIRSDGRRSKERNEIGYEGRDRRRDNITANMRDDVRDEMMESGRSDGRRSKERNERTYERDEWRDEREYNSRSGGGQYKKRDNERTERMGLRRFDITDDLSEGMTESIKSERSERRHSERNDMKDMRKMKYETSNDLKGRNERNGEWRHNERIERQPKRKSDGMRYEGNDELSNSFMVDRLRDEGRRYKERYEMMNGGVRNGTAGRIGQYNESEVGRSKQETGEWGRKMGRNERKASDDYSDHDSVFV